MTERRRERERLAKRATARTATTAPSSSTSPVVPGYNFAMGDDVDWANAVPPERLGNFPERRAKELRDRPPPPPDAGVAANAHNPTWIMSFPLPETVEHSAFKGNKNKRTDQASAFSIPFSTIHESGVSSRDRQRRSQAQCNRNNAMQQRYGAHHPSTSAQGPSLGEALSGGDADRDERRRTSKQTRAPGAKNTATTTRNRARPQHQQLQGEAQQMQRESAVSTQRQQQQQQSSSSSSSSPPPPSLPSAASATSTRTIAQRVEELFHAQEEENQRELEMLARLAAAAINEQQEQQQQQRQEEGDAVVSLPRIASASSLRESRQEGTVDGPRTPPPPTTTSSTIRGADSSSNTVSAHTPPPPSSIAPATGATRGAVGRGSSGSGSGGGVPWGTSFDVPLQQLLNSRQLQHRLRRQQREQQGAEDPIAGGNAGGWEISDFSYESLLELSSMAVSTGLDKNQLARYKPQSYNKTKKDTKKKKKDDEDEDCAICLEALEQGQQALQISCGHWFHHECIVAWLARTNRCPTCRFEIPRR